ncbi:uncharacterized protein TA05190 [Theileria annulata]|uniref:SET domain-containing protein n=1 Tax=Theileria annulata TaxID=5874 RepID=Q4UBM9_THEAN|nr:uncharacterized protein TA05190 [Theileria annulata]CAI75772.1 hypothetical protein TA05190 [Theileria annulata]|eukprot:XP_955248.1 hypothetical protein TA05190 [Theileria annulata]
MDEISVFKQSEHNLLHSEHDKIDKNISNFNQNYIKPNFTNNFYTKYNTRSFNTTKNSENKLVKNMGRSRYYNFDDNFGQTYMNTRRRRLNHYINNNNDITNSNGKLNDIDLNQHNVFDPNNIQFNDISNMDTIDTTNTITSSNLSTNITENMDNGNIIGSMESDSKNRNENMINPMSKDEFQRRLKIMTTWYNKFPIIKTKKDTSILMPKRVNILPIEKKPFLIETPHGLDVRFDLSILIDILTCYLCKGLLYNAHTIKDCMHTFCKSCLILSTFESFFYSLIDSSIQLYIVIYIVIMVIMMIVDGLVCPMCFTPIHTSIAEGVESDTNIQTIVDKLFPEFAEHERKQKEEMERQIKLYKTENTNTSINSSDSGKSEVKELYFEEQKDIIDRKSKLSDSTATFLNELNKCKDINKLFDNVLCLALVHESDNQINSIFNDINNDKEDSKDSSYSDITVRYPRKYICVPKRLQVADIVDYLINELLLEPEYNVVFMLKNLVLQKKYTIEFIFQTFNIDTSKCVVFRYKIILQQSFYNDWNQPLNFLMLYNIIILVINNVIYEFLPKCVDSISIDRNLHNFNNPSKIKFNYGYIPVFNRFNSKLNTHVDNKFINDGFKEIKNTNDEINELIDEVEKTYGKDLNINIKSMSRLDYNRDFLLKTFNLAKEVDMKVSKNNYQEGYNNLVSFSGDDEEELMMFSKEEMCKGETIVNIPLKSCISLESTIKDLVNNINKYSQINPKFANYLQYISGLMKFNIGNFIKPNIAELSGEDQFHQINVDKFTEFVTYKRILTLKSLILCDIILSIDDKNGKLSRYAKFNSINSNEKELSLLTMALSSEYFLNSIAQMLNCNNSCSEVEFGDLKMKWINWLFNKKESHIPLMFDKGSVEQVQEPIIQNKIVQRKLALAELFSIFTDPMSVIRDKIETLHNKPVDLDGLEEYLLNNNIKHEVFEENIFKISKAEVEEILRNTIDASDRSNNTSNAVDIINSMINFESILNFFCTITSHIVRPKVDKIMDNTQYYYMLNTANGIDCQIDITNSDNGGNGIDVLNYGYLVPIISLCNHSNSKPNSDISLIYSDGELTFSLKTTSDIAVNSEILINYGECDNNTLLLDYGFVSGDEGNNWVLMGLDNDLVRDSAKKNEVNYLMPSIFPEGIPKEKLDLIKQLNLIEVHDKGDLSEIYSDPYFDGMPIIKYMEFNERFMANTIDIQSNLYYSTNSKQERTFHVDKPDDYNFINCAQNVNNILKINSNGIIDHRLILLIKIILCKTKKKLEWIKKHSPELLSKSINSPIDYKAFEVVSSIPLIYVDNKYDQSLYDDVCSLKNVKNGMKRNMMLTAHAMRQKIPFYKCAHHYRSISSITDNSTSTLNKSVIQVNN